MMHKYRWLTTQRLELPESPDIELRDHEEKLGQPKGGHLALSPRGNYLAFWDCRGHHRFWKKRVRDYVPLQPAVPPIISLVHRHGRRDDEFIVGTLNEDLGVGCVRLAGDTFASLGSFTEVNEFARDLQVSPNGRWYGGRFFQTYALSRLSTKSSCRTFDSNQVFALSNSYYSTDADVYELPDAEVFEWPEGMPSDLSPNTPMTKIDHVIRIHRLESGEVVRRIRNIDYYLRCWFSSEEHLVYTAYGDAKASGNSVHRVHVPTGCVDSIYSDLIGTAVAVSPSLVVAGTELGQLIVCDFEAKIAIPVEMEFRIRDRIISVTADRNHNIGFCSRDGIAAVGRIVGLGPGGESPIS